MRIDTVVIPPDVLEKIGTKHHVHEYEVYQALQNMESARKSRKKFECISRTKAGRILRVHFRYYGGTATIVSARDEK